MTRQEAPARAGRKRDPALDGRILDAALTVLADTGYDRMTIDMVAARAESARASVYRRWPSKAELVLDAIAHLSRTDVDLSDLPDTGTLRSDLLAMVIPETFDEQQLRMKIVAGLQSLAATDSRFSGTVLDAGVEPWIEAQHVLIQRAIDRGEFPPADVDALAQVIPMICISRIAVQQQPITREFSLGLIDGVLLPALRSAPSSK